MCSGVHSYEHYFKYTYELQLVIVSNIIPLDLFIFIINTTYFRHTQKYISTLVSALQSVATTYTLVFNLSVLIVFLGLLNFHFKLVFILKTKHGSILSGTQQQPTRN